MSSLFPSVSLVWPLLPMYPPLLVCLSFAPSISLGLYLCSRVSPCGLPFPIYLPLLLGEEGADSERWAGSPGSPFLPCCQAWHCVGAGGRD